MTVLLIITCVAVMASWYVSREKTFEAFRLAFVKMKRLAIPFGWMIILAAVGVTLLSQLEVLHLLSGFPVVGATLFALIFGSVALMPGAVAFPLGALFLEQGVAHMSVAAFTTAIMTVGIVTFPMERAYLGTKVALIRNIVGMVIAGAVALAVGVYFGDWL